MTFEPIAVVGRGCVLPGAHDPDTFWRNIVAGRTSFGPAPDERWRGPRPLTPGDGTGDPLPDTGGFVRDFTFDSAGLLGDPSRLAGLDASLHWMLHSARAALAEAGRPDGARCGLILGTLASPTARMSRAGHHVWTRDAPEGLRAALAVDEVAPTADDVLMAGHAARLVADALGLHGVAFTVEAACASSLYGLKLACDQLRDRTADVMVAGAFNGVDTLLLHLAFREVSALSPSGRSRPFQRDADGLLPAQGAAAVTLMRLSDAVAAGVGIHGVIRGIGLSNDGRAAGPLVPDENGQVAAIRQAYAAAGLDPATVSLVECHATGTPRGDLAEVHSMRRVFPGDGELPIGSVKGNIGHTFAVAGLAGLLKLLGALGAGVLPPTAGVREPVADLAGSGLRVPRSPEPWAGPRRAALSSFGFGGNNAHLVLEAYDRGPVTAPAPAVRRFDCALAVVGVGALVGAARGTAELRRALFTGTAPEPARAVPAALDGLRFPPRDLRSALSQQTLVFEAAREATAGLELPGERTMVVIGMGVDAEAARFGARERIRSWLPGLDDPGRLAALAEALAPPLDAAGVLGTMPNLVVNRINAQLDLTGPSFGVLAEDGSGLVALAEAARALRHGEADAAVVGAVDAATEPVLRAVLAELGRDERGTDAAVVLVLRRAADARAAGDEIIALLDPEPPADGPAELEFGPAGISAARIVGDAHAAAGLLDVAAAALALRHQAVPAPGAPAAPALDARTARVVRRDVDGRTHRVRLWADRTMGWSPAPAPRPHVFSGRDRAEVVEAVLAGRESDTGPARLVVLAEDDGRLRTRAAAAGAWLTGTGVRPAGVAYRDRPVSGEVGFVFAGGISAYPEMGRDLLLAFPEQARGLSARSGLCRSIGGWAYVPGADPATPTVEQQILASGQLGWVHAAISRDVLGLRPDAALGYSAGEATALFALGVWPDDVAGYVDDLAATGMFTRMVAGEFEVVRRARARIGDAARGWANHLVGAAAPEVRAALAGEPLVHLAAINAPRSCLIGGDPLGCARVLDRLRPDYTVAVPYALAVHVPETAEVAEQWWRLNHRRVVAPPHTRFYTCGTVAAYRPTATACADALTRQATGMMDFAATVELAFQDGVRIFVEHGPRSLCADWIGAILTGREHVAVALDGDGGPAAAIAELVAAGVAVRADTYFAALAAASARPAESRQVIELPVHLPPVVLPELPGEPMTRTSSRAVSPALSHHHGVAEAHKCFLTEQAEAHRRFLEVCARVTGPPNAPRADADPVLPGPKFDRAQLEYAACGRLSKLFGPEFEPQDRYLRQTRMPAPPMLLVDRVTGIDAEPASMGLGTIWTETDVTADAWYLDTHRRMPPGLMMEAGQADLLLISWLGVDLLNRGERVYRLLGCEVTLHGPVVRAGETLRFEITVDGHAEFNGVRLFFFHYDGYVGSERRLSVRGGQAGFFTDDELAAGEGVLFDPAAEHLPETRVDDPPLPTGPRSFSAGQVEAFALGRPADCFGGGWEPTRRHGHPPCIPAGNMRLLREVTACDPAGGPWGRGYLRATMPVAPDDWFFAGHFVHDPCMPGTLMFEGCFQAMSFYLAALGCTVSRDGWRFEPLPERAYPMRCRGQVTPASRELVYEVLVREFLAEPEPVLIADLLCTVDGRLSFHAARVGLRLVPGDGSPEPEPAG